MQTMTTDPQQACNGKCPVLVSEFLGNSFRRSWSPTAEDSSQQPGFTEGSRFGNMLSVEPHAGVDDYLSSELSDMNGGTNDLYERSRPYRRAEFSDSLQPISRIFHLVEEFSEYRHRTTS
jgi:hypothetical protein